MYIKEEKGLAIVNLIFLLLIIISSVFYTHQIVVHLAAIVFVVFIYRYFAKDIKQYLYFISIFLALMGSAIMVPVTRSISINLWYISVLAYLIYFFVEIFKHNKVIAIIKDFKNMFTIFFAVFILYIVVSIFFVKSISFALTTLKLYVVMIPLAVMFVIQNYEENMLNKTFTFFVYVYTFILIFGTLETFGLKFGLDNNLILQGKYTWNWDFYKRVPITFFYNQNNYAVFMVLGMLFLLVAAAYERNTIKKLIFLALAVISQINLIFTSSRTAILTIFIILFSSVLLGIITRSKLLVLDALKSIVFVSLTFFIVSFFTVTQPYYGKFDDLPGVKFLNVSKYSVYQKYFVNTETNNAKSNTQQQNQNSDLTEKQNNVNQNKIDEKQNSEVQNKIEENKYIEENKERLSEEGTSSSRVRLNIIEAIIKGVIYDKHYFGFGVGNTGWLLKNQKNLDGVINAHSMWFEFLGDYGIFMFAYFLFIYAAAIITLIVIFNRYYRQSKSSIYGSSNKRGSMLPLMAAIGIYGFAFLSFGPSSVVNYTPFWILVGVSGAIIMNYKYKEI